MLEITFDLSSFSLMFSKMSVRDKLISLYTVLPLCVYGFISHGDPIRGIRVFADHARRNKHKQNETMIFVCDMASHACLS